MIVSMMVDDSFHDRRGNGAFSLCWVPKSIDFGYQIVRSDSW